MGSEQNPSLTTSLTQPNPPIHNPTHTQPHPQLSLDDNGEILFTPLGYMGEIIDDLISGCVNIELCLVKRTDCARVLLEILKRSTPEEIQLPLPQQQYMYSEPKVQVVKNKLFHIASQFRGHLLRNVGRVCAGLVEISSDTFVGLKVSE